MMLTKQDVWLSSEYLQEYHSFNMLREIVISRYTALQDIQILSLAKQWNRPIFNKGDSSALWVHPLTSSPSSVKNIKNFKKEKSGSQ